MSRLSTKILQQRCRGTLKITRNSNPRSLSSASSSSEVSVVPPPQPVVVLRDDILFPKSVTTYQEILTTSATLTPTTNVDSHLRFVSRPFLGGDLNTVTHAMFFEGGLKQWQQLQQEQQEDDDTTNSILDISVSNLVDQWQNDDLVSCIQRQQSTVYVEAPFIQNGVTGVEQNPPGLKDLAKLQALEGTIATTSARSSPTIFEVRKYNLRLGYDTVPNFLKLYGEGLPSKLTAPGTDESTSLVTLLYSEVGRLNEVIEIWRHGNGLEGMERSRVAARSAGQWRSAIKKIADLAIEFRSTVHQPLEGYSPLQ